MVVLVTTNCAPTIYTGAMTLDQEPGFVRAGSDSRRNPGALVVQDKTFVLAERVITSGRNLRAHSFWRISRLLIRLALRGPDGFRDRRGLDLWYRPLREKAP